MWTNLLWFELSLETQLLVLGMDTPEIFLKFYYQKTSTNDCLVIALIFPVFRLLCCAGQRERLQWNLYITKLSIQRKIFSYPSNSKIYVREPRYNETSV